MNNQVTVASDAKVTKADAASAKQAPAQSKKEKAPKVKTPKTAFSGRLEQVEIASDGSIRIALKDKRGKTHDFTLSAPVGGNAMSGQLLAAALNGKAKIHVTTTAEKPELVISLSLNVKK